MASSRKSRRAEAVTEAVSRALAAHALRAQRVAVGLSGGVDSVVLLHALRAVASRHGIRLVAVHVNHGLSPHADGWSRFCRALCRRWDLPITVRRVCVVRKREGLEAAARAARYAALARTRAAALVLAHQLDDQAETVLLNLLRGAGLAGARGMPAVARWRDRLLLRPLLELPRASLLDYARRHRLDWIEDESNASPLHTRNFLRGRIAPLLAERFPRWRENLARAARHFAAAELDANRVLRDYLASQGLRAPSERRLLEMLRQLSSARHDARTAIRHDGVVLRRYQERIVVTRAAVETPFVPVRWQGEAKLALPALRGELRFRRVRGEGIDASRLGALEWTVRLRAGGERLQPDARRPRRALKNLFQEAGIPPWERERMPMLYCDDALAWVPGLGVDVRFRALPGAPGLVPTWYVLGAAENAPWPPSSRGSRRRAATGRVP